MEERGKRPFVFTMHSCSLQEHKRTTWRAGKGRAAMRKLCRWMNLPRICPDEVINMVVKLGAWGLNYSGKDSNTSKITEGLFWNPASRLRCYSRSHELMLPRGGWQLFKSTRPLPRNGIYQTSGSPFRCCVTSAVPTRLVKLSQGTASVSARSMVGITAVNAGCDWGTHTSRRPAGLARPGCWEGRGR